MLEFFKENCLRPLMGRIGTAAATLLIGYGVEGPLAQQVAVGVTAFGLVVADFAIDFLNRKRVVNRTIDIMMGR